MSKKLSHVDEAGRASMVDVGGKPLSQRTAVAESFIRLQPETLELIATGTVAKGEVLAIARVAGIQAAKATATLIPLCHTLSLSKLSVDFSFSENGIGITALAKTMGQTGVEMEALTAVSVAALTIYDMCKAVDGLMQIGPTRLLEKRKE